MPVDLEARIDSIPLVDVALAEVIALLDDPESNFDRITRKLSPEVIAKFLTMAGTAFYGRAVRNIEYAVRVLGYDRMKQILITSIMLSHFSRRSELEGFNFQNFQMQAQFCASVARTLGLMVGYERVEDLFTISMLQNIGKLVIALHFKEEHKLITFLKRLEGISSGEAERRVIGFDHAELGAAVLKKFGIPDQICEAVRYHEFRGSLPVDRSKFELFIIVKQAAEITDSFILPDEDGLLRIHKLLKGSVREGLDLCNQIKRKEMRSKGYDRLFGEIIEEASDLVRDVLKEALPERVPDR